MMVNGGNIKKGMYIMFKGEPHMVTLTEFVSPGKGSAFMRTKLKSVKTGSVVEFTFKSVEMVEEADVSSVEMQYLYQDGEDFVFMNPRSFEQLTIPGYLMTDYVPFMLPEQTMYVLLFNEQPIGVRFPNKVTLKVTYAEDAVAGGRINAPKKKVKLETGYEIDVPLFIKEGESVIVDTATGLYVSRANE
ncbi:elongation factor P [Candidatus Cerribacteria bacterium 'Amazon FNV 2010 28 9']|uniref:Elongation factor P n=1 Tax=Candidatus Cerribacteria bacterium 'Amazon FNV 2010 28 9' TaxID=2081795 RepID=A0A317JP43_9BACT|nr:MAG: elongation factor P [Candidatus Cerribacteria bacterium 'Amazon FNV 2010 28 9']